MKQKLLLTFFAALLSYMATAQVSIVVPSGPDTVVCNGAPLTMQAINNGYNSHTVSLSVDDQNSPLYPIGFSFNYYGNTYTNFVISSNGYITFNASAASSYSAWSIGSGIPANTAIRNSICGVYADIYIPSGGTVSYGVAGVAPYRKLVVNFCDTRLFSCTTLKASFQIILYETSNVIEVHTKRKDACTSWNSGYAIQGIENATGSTGTPSPGRNYPSLWTVLTPDAYRFTPDATLANYTVTSIPFNPVPDSSATISWYSGTTLLGTGPSVVVNPTVPTTYEARAITCGDTSRAFVNVTIGTGPAISSITSTSPTVCGLCDGSVTLHGLLPGSSDTINYYLGAVAQPTFVGVPNAAGDITIPGLCAGTYTNFTAKVGYCTSAPYASVTVTPPPFTISSISFVNPTVCGVCNGSMTINGLVPGYSDTVNYIKDGVPQPQVIQVASASGTITLTGLCAGVYSGITVKMNNCIANGPTTTLTNPVFFISSVSNTSPSVCGACDATIIINGLVPGFSDTVNYIKDGVAQTPVVLVVPASGTIVLTGLCAGVYSNITVKMNTCTTAAAGPLTITNPAFGIADTSSTNASCSACDGTITLYGLTPLQTITVNYSYNGTPQPAVVTTSDASGRVTIHNLCPGTYTNVTATLNTCVSNPVGTFIISAPPLIPIAVVGSTQPTECGICNGNITIKGCPPGPIDTVYYSMNGVPQPPVLYSSGPDSTLTIYNLCAGTYSNFFIKVGPCPTVTITTPVILSNPPIVPAFTSTIQYGCTFDNVFFHNASTTVPGGSLWYVWHFGDGTTDTSANPVHSYPQGTYNVTLIITNHYCVDSITSTIVLNHPIQASFTGDTIACQKNPVQFTSTSVGTPPTYVWSFGDGTTSTASAPTHIFTNVGTYTVQLIATNFVPCSDTAYATIFIDSLSSLAISLTDTVLCQSTYVTMSSIYANVGVTGLTWSFGDGDSIKDVNPVIYAYHSTGTFVLTSTVNFRICPNLSVSRTVTVVPQPTINLGPDTAICGGSETILLSDFTNGGNTAASWLWNTGTTTYNYLVSEPGSYFATVTIGNCSASDSVVVREDCYMSIPNIFTPNGDGVNDYFYPRQFLSSGLTGFKMDIYNRWGQLIFTTNSVDGRGWDGKFNGEAQTEGVYVYIIDGTFKDGKKEHHQGNLTLLR